MTGFAVARAVFVGVVAYTAFLLSPLAAPAVVNAVFGAAIGAAVVAVEVSLTSVSVTGLLGAVIGGAIGLGLAETLVAALYWANLSDGRVVFLHTLILLALPYIGLAVGSRNREWLEPRNLMALFRAGTPRHRHKILDTSVIIDGRIAELCEAGFLDGTLVVPQFVLKELQLVADSADAIKRNRGRRGLDILHRIQKMSVTIEISDVDYPHMKEVDLKLIELALALGGKIVSNDFNLSKVAQVRGVEVLNINALASALRPVVLPGELLTVLVHKEGKEYNQGVAYLDDGTMVVVDNARRMIGKSIEVVVTSVLQTTAGKMMFGKLSDAAGSLPVGTMAPVSPLGDARRPSRDQMASPATAAK